MLFGPDLCVYCKMYSTLQFIKETFRTCSQSCNDFHHGCHHEGTLAQLYLGNMDGSKILRMCAIIFFVSTPESVTDAAAEGEKAAA